MRYGYNLIQSIVAPSLLNDLCQVDSTQNNEITHNLINWYINLKEISSLMSYLWTLKKAIKQKIETTILFCSGKKKSTTKSLITMASLKEKS